jgi:hypothetical protein
MVPYTTSTIPTVHKPVAKRKRITSFFSHAAAVDQVEFYNGNRKSKIKDRTL